jgi:hypothetical protein
MGRIGFATGCDTPWICSQSIRPDGTLGRWTSHG